MVFAGSSALNQPIPARAFGSDADRPVLVRWVAIASLPPSSAIEGRAPVVTAWANYVTQVLNPESSKQSQKRQTMLENNLIKFRGDIGEDVVNAWNGVVYPQILQNEGIFSKDSHASVAPGLLNAKLLINGEPDFVRPTGSNQMHSVLWPVTQISMTKDDSIMFDDSRMYTSAIAGENLAPGDPWYNANSETVPEADATDPLRKYAWFRWATALLSTGGIPYVRHTSYVPTLSDGAVLHIPVRARPHLTMDEMGNLARSVSKKLIT